MNKHWQIWVDTGGTFTDCFGISPQGTYQRLKLLSSSRLRGNVLKQLTPDSFSVQLFWPIQANIFQGFTLRHRQRSYVIEAVDTANSMVYIKGEINVLPHDVIEIETGEEVPVLAARILTQTRLSDSFPPIQMRLGSTKGTNAMLERKGAATALLITEGFTDLLLIGNQQRPDLFALKIEKELPLYTCVIPVPERIRSSGRVEKKLSGAAIVTIIRQLKKKKILSVAVCLLNSYKNDVHEQQLKKALLKNGFSFVTLSSEVSSQARFLPRTETAVVNAYLQPVIHHYLQGIRSGLASADIQVMTSSGSLVSMGQFLPKDSLLSGPAGGIVGASMIGEKSNRNHLITFDMGGTSTDVSLYHQGFTYRYESSIGQRKILAPSLAIETIAAGGGSICSFDGYRLLVGPHSAGAFPGPACYGADGPLTMTDVNLLLGRLDESLFAFPLHRNKAEAALLEVQKKMKRATGSIPSSETLLESFIQIANEKMAEAIRKVSVQQGYDPSQYSLLCFGGAGGQHACALGNLLGISEVIIPYDAGLLSAYGIGHARRERQAEALVLTSLERFEKSQKSKLARLYFKAKAALEADGVDPSRIRLLRQEVFLRFKGQEATIEIDATRPVNLRKAFRKKYLLLFGHWMDRPIEVESIRVSAVEKGKTLPKGHGHVKEHKAIPDKVVRSYIQGRWNDIPVCVWENLQTGAVIQGPSLLISRNSTVTVDKGWCLRLDANNHALLKQETITILPEIAQQEALLELFTNRFTAIAEEMGALLQRTSFSVNVKERLDFSCALLDAEGYLVVNAPHIPVHLGSLGVCVREVSKVISWEEGDVVITNHPAFGGSHLPDVTLIKPVYVHHQCMGFVANRAHHAEIGGKRPGSMPADAITLEEEGVIIAPTYLVKAGVVQWKAIHDLFCKATFPTRQWQENQADLSGALAAIQLGERLLIQLCETEGADRVVHYMGALRDHAHALMKRHLQHHPHRQWQALEKLDDGSALRVRIKNDGKHLIFDFTGTATVHSNNLNATPAIVQSVVLYVLRLWLNQPVPMNEGLMDGVQIILPKSLLSPDFHQRNPMPAVVGGNTEVSQRLTDTLLKALGLLACSQGTMNNFLMGNAHFGYYETIGGGTGAGNGFHGTDAIHHHMTNTRMTDPELMELRYPVQVLVFAIRKKSGGLGQWRGGDGITRILRFWETLEINILSQHRKEKPYGLEGGKPGKTGRQYLLLKKGEKKILKGMDHALVKPGDRLVMETPGGGGANG